MADGYILTEAPIITMTIPQALGNALLRAWCLRRGHPWREHGRAMKHGQRFYCTRCESQKVVLTDDVAWHAEMTVECSKADMLARDPLFAEALYVATWSEPPKQRLRRGEWPLP